MTPWNVYAGHVGRLPVARSFDVDDVHASIARLQARTTSDRNTVCQQCSAAACTLIQINGLPTKTPLRMSFRCLAPSPMDMLERYQDSITVRGRATSPERLYP